MKKNPAGKRIWVPMLFLVVCCAAAGAPAAAAGSDTLCIHFTGATAGMHIQLIDEVSINGTLPLTLCNLEQGRIYSITAGGRGLERRRGYFSIGAQGVPRVRGNRAGSAARNAILPGWGSWTAGRVHTGWSDPAAIAVTGYVLLREFNEYRRIEDRLDDLHAALASTENAEERRRIRSRAWHVSRELNVQNAHRRRVAAFTAYLYLFQLVDPWLVGIPPAASIEAGGTVVHLQSAGSSRAKAMGLSLLRPGRGQFYQGKQGRGALYSLLTAAAGLYVLDKHNAYDGAVNVYEMNIERFNAAQTIDEKEHFRDRAPALWDDVAEAKRTRNIGYGVLAAVWTACVIDAFFPGREEIFYHDLALDIGPTGAALVYRF